MITMLTTNISKFFSFISTSIGRGFNINDYIVAEILIIFKFAYLQAINSSLVLKSLAFKTKSRPKLYKRHVQIEDK